MKSYLRAVAWFQGFSAIAIIFLVSSCKIVRGADPLPPPVTGHTGAWQPLPPPVAKTGDRMETASGVIEYRGGVWVYVKTHKSGTPAAKGVAAPAPFLEAASTTLATPAPPVVLTATQTPTYSTVPAPFAAPTGTAALWTEPSGIIRIRGYGKQCNSYG